MSTLRVALLSLFLGASTAWGAPPSSAADPTNATELVAAVESTYASITSLRADFVQVTRSASMGQETRQKGKVQLARPKKMRWDFQAPDASTFVTDGHTMWVYSSANNQVIVSTVAAGSGSGMTELLDDLNNLDELFTVTLLDGADSPAKAAYQVELVPKKQANFKKLRLTLSKKKYEVQQVLLTDQFDNQVDLSFSQIRTNQPIPDSTFTFQIPAGAQVIKTDAQ